MPIQLQQIADDRLIELLLDSSRFSQTSKRPVPRDAVQPGDERLRIGQARQIPEDIEPNILQGVFRFIGTPRRAFPTGRPCTLQQTRAAAGP